MNTYKAILFDLDDTLVKTASIKWAHHKAVAREFYNIELTNEVLGEHWGKPFNQMIGFLYQNADTVENMIAANRSIEDRFLKERLEGALETIHFLIESRIPVGVLTSTMREFCVRDLARNEFPVDDFFLIQGADCSPAHKPDPRVFDSAKSTLKEKGITDGIVYVGDALIDFYAARDAGLEFIGVTTGLTTKEKFKEAGVTHCLESVSQLSFII